MSTSLPAHLKSHKTTQWMVALIVSVTTVTTGQASGWALAALPKIEKGELGISLTRQEISWVVSLLFIGNIFSPLLSAFIMDIAGRKRSLHFFSSWLIAAWLLIYVTHATWALYVARFIMGTWFGATFTILPVYLGETLDANIRGTAISLLGIGFYLGTLIQSSLGPYVTFDQLTIISVTISTLYCVALFWIPESPYFYLMRGKRDAAVESLTRLRGSSAASDIRIIEAVVEEQMKNPCGYKDIFATTALRKAFLISQVLRIIQRSSGQSILSSYGSVDIPPSFVSSETSAIVLSATWLVTSIMAVWTVDYYGRKIMAFISCAGISLAMSVVSIWYFLRDNTSMDLSSTQWLPLAGFMLQGVAYAGGMVTIPTIVQGELFPVNIKSKASSLTCISFALSSALVVKIYQPISDAIGLYFNFLICAIMCFFGAIFVFRVMFETKGRTLEEIQNKMNKEIVITEL